MQSSCDSRPKGKPRSETNTKGDSIDSRLSRRRARNSTPDSGCVDGSPFFARFTWMRALAKSMLSHFRLRRPPTPATNVVDISRARAKAAAPIVKTSNIAELNQMLAGSSPNPWAPPPGW